MGCERNDDWTCLAGECRIQAWPSLHEMSQVIAESADLPDRPQLSLGLPEAKELDLPTEHFSVLQHAAKTHNVTFAAYLRAILVDALAEEGLLVQ